MAEREILLLGDERLYDISAPVLREELHAATLIAADLSDTLAAFRRDYGWGRAIAAPQIGAFKRIVYMQIDQPVVLINPELSRMSGEMLAVWDDCMSFPALRVKVRRHRRCEITYRDLAWNQHSHPVEDDLAELLQHECDHLNGVLAVSRAVDDRSFALERDRRKKR